MYIKRYNSDHGFEFLFQKLMVMPLFPQNIQAWKIYFQIPYIFQDFHDRGNPDSFIRLPLKYIMKTLKGHVAVLELPFFKEKIYFFN